MAPGLFWNIHDNRKGTNFYTPACCPHLSFLVLRNILSKHVLNMTHTKLFFLHYIDTGSLFLKSGYTILSSRTRNLIPFPTTKPLDCLSYEIIKLYGQENGLNYYKHDLSSCDSRDVLIEGQSWWYSSTVRSSSLRAGPPRCRTDARAELPGGC